MLVAASPFSSPFATPGSMFSSSEPLGSTGQLTEDFIFSAVAAWFSVLIFVPVYNLTVRDNLRSQLICPRLRRSDEVMCFSATASFAASTLLVPLGVAGVIRAHQVDRRYIPLCTLPVLFGLQQFFEGMVWIAGAGSDAALVERYSLAYMFFSWIAWPVWVPVSVYFLEPSSRKLPFLVFAIGGAMLGSLQYVPYFAHDGWLTTTFLDHAVRYTDIELLDALITREATYLIYLTFIIAPLLLSSNRDAQIFGVLVAIVLTITYFFFSFAYISVFCMGGALMSFYLVFMIFRKERSPTDRAITASIG